MPASHEEHDQRIIALLDETRLELEKYRYRLKVPVRRRFGTLLAEEDLDDIAGDTIEWAFRHIYQYNPVLSAVSTWLNTRAHYETLQYLKKNPRASVNIEDLADTLAGEVERQSLGVTQLSPELLQALEQIRPRRAEVIRLHYVEEFSIQAIAEQLAIEPVSVRSHLSRGLADLRRLLCTNRQEPDRMPEGEVSGALDDETASE